ncbi:hypothetical protein AB0K23_29810 [Streptomyces sp. NPDC049602]|uniref:hypothetical protein n=1 Tax=Streptomyces sp. NPDC049602 TaxID=3155504 RepID=UPI003439265A
MPENRAALNAYVNAILRLRAKDATAGFRARRAEALRVIDLTSVHSNGYSFRVEMNHRTVRRGFTSTRKFRFASRNASGARRR